MPVSDARFRELYRTYGRVVYARCRRILGDGAAAEDATQETFLRVFRHLAKAPDNEQAIAWIYRIATNYCLNELRDRRTRPQPSERVEAGASAAHDPSGKPSLEAVLGNREQAWRVITGLPEKLRAVAYLHHVDGLDQTEVARILSVSRRTVVYRLAEFQVHARRLLAEGK
jgi:RNA polymerase sigma-70 factor (ECF subfamily)